MRAIKVRFASGAISAGMVLGVAGAAKADPVLLSHPPNQYGRYGSDTLWEDEFGNELWQLVADDFKLAFPATVTHLGWWGFYHLDNPPATETMRARLHELRPDGLPGDVL